MDVSLILALVIAGGLLLSGLLYVLLRGEDAAMRWLRRASDAAPRTSKR